MYLVNWWHIVKSPIQMCILLVLLSLSACGDNSQRGKLEAEQLQAMRVEAARLEAIRMEAERARLEQEARIERERQARNYARTAGRQIMKAIGGGQDLIVNHKLRYFDESTRTLEIGMDVSFNGAIFRSNHYQVSGVLTVGQNGSKPKFARRAANQNYLDAESTMTALGVTIAGVLILNEMSNESGKTQKNNKKSTAVSWQIETLELCNGIKTEAVNAAIAYTDNRENYTSGWYVLEDDRCVTISSINAREKVRVFGFSKNRTWSGDSPLCVKMSEGFKMPQSSDSCRTGATVQNFFWMKLNKPGDGRLKITFNAKLDADLEKMVAQASRSNSSQ